MPISASLLLDFASQDEYTSLLDVQGFFFSRILHENSQKTDLVIINSALRFKWVFDLIAWSSGKLILLIEGMEETENLTHSYIQPSTCASEWEWCGHWRDLHGPHCFAVPISHFHRLCLIL